MNFFNLLTVAINGAILPGSGIISKIMNSDFGNSDKAAVLPSEITSALQTVLLGLATKLFTPEGFVSDHLDIMKDGSSVAAKIPSVLALWNFDQVKDLDKLNLITDFYDKDGDKIATKMMSYGVVSSIVDGLKDTDIIYDIKGLPIWIKGNHEFDEDHAHWMSFFNSPEHIISNVLTLTYDVYQFVEGKLVTFTAGTPLEYIFNSIKGVEDLMAYDLFDIQGRVLVPKGTPIKEWLMETSYKHDILENFEEIPKFTEALVLLMDLLKIYDTPEAS